MAIQLPAGAVPAAAERAPRAGMAFSAVPVVAVMGLAAVFVGLVMALALVAEHLFGMSTGGAWGYSTGVISYLTLFTSFIYGVVKLVNRG